MERPTEKDNLSERENGIANGHNETSKLSAELGHAARAPPVPASFAHIDEKKVLRKVRHTRLIGICSPMFIIPHAD